MNSLAKCSTFAQEKAIKPSSVVRRETSLLIHVPGECNINRGATTSYLAGTVI